MINLQGKRNSAIIYADKIDKQTKTQIAELLREEAYSDSKIRIMPDTHAGKNVAVGTTMTLKGRVNPSLVGVDIGCGMEAVFLKEEELDFALLDDVVHRLVPCGARIHEEPVSSFDLEKLHCKQGVDLPRAARSLGSLGGGNHFIEVDRLSNGKLLLVIHSGSRQLGSDVAGFYQDLAYKTACKKARRQVKSRRYDEDPGYGFKSQKRENNDRVKIKREDAILSGSQFEEYLEDLSIVTAFAEKNRQIMAERICRGAGLTILDSFSCVHNYIDTEHMILRKGAISARQGEQVIIPLNMRDGVILGQGLGNPDWNFSAPHGAGRACSRSDAKFAYTVEEFQKEMEGIYTTTANEGSLDECPMAYKAPQRILDFLSDSVEVKEIAKPVYNFKAC